MSYKKSANTETAVDLCLISPIPLNPKNSAAVNQRFTMSSRPSPDMTWVSPPSQHNNRQSLGNAASKSMVTSMLRSDMSREVYHLIRDNLPKTMRDSTTLPQLILISRSIEKKLYQNASSYNAYLNPTTLKFRISALACAVLIHSEDGSRKEHSETCARLLAAARNSLQHCCMVLVSYETRELDKRFIRGVSYDDILY
jgi:hypothetical protein